MTVRITFKGRIDVSAGLNDIHHIRRIGDDTKAAARQSPNYIKKTKQKIKYGLNDICAASGSIFVALSSATLTALFRHGSAVCPVRPSVRLSVCHIMQLWLVPKTKESLS